MINLSVMAKLMVPPLVWTSTSIAMVMMTGHDEDSFFCGNFEWVSETTFPYQLTLGYEQTIFV